jgi:broad specificity phosphatase PhoE
MATTELLMVRHGQSEANVGTSTHPDCGLTELGLEQARAAARKLASLDLRGFEAITSPYRRALCTAQVIAEATGLRFSQEPAVREWGPTATVGEAVFEQEPVEQAVRRLEAFLRERRSQKLVIVSHAAPIAILTQLAWGEPPSTQGQFWLGVGNCCPRWVKTTVA